MGGCCSSQSRDEDPHHHHLDNHAHPRPLHDTVSNDGQQPETSQAHQRQLHHSHSSLANPSLQSDAFSGRPSHNPFRRGFSGSQGGNNLRDDTAGGNAPNRPLMPAPASHMIEAPLVAPTSNEESTGAGGGLGDLGPARTAAQVRAARDEFFDTRTSGRSEMWAAVRLVCELVERGELQDAQAVLDAAGGTCPSGQIWGRKGGCYDERGERYVVPMWCVGWPDGIERDDYHDVRTKDDGLFGEINSALGGSLTGGAAVEEGGRRGAQGSDTEELTTGRQRGVSASKGKGRATDDVEGQSGALVGENSMKGKEIKVRARLSHNARDIVVKVGDEDDVSSLIGKVRSSAKLSPSTKIHVGYLGRMLSEKDTLVNQGWREGHVVNIFVFE